MRKSLQAYFGLPDRGVGEGDSPGVDGARAWWSSVVLLLGVLTIPFVVAQVPPLTDYPNHLARCYVLAFGGSDPVLSRMFSAHWQIIPNIAIDLILPALMHIFSPFVAGRIVLAFCVIAPTSGAIALSRALFGRRSFWQLTAGFAAFNVLFLMGFMNFCLAIGVAMWGAAGWIHFRERSTWTAVAIGTVVGISAFFFHIMGLFFYGLLVGCYEVFAILDGGLQTAHQRWHALKRVLIAAVPLIAPFLLYLQSPLGRVAGGVEWTSYRRKFYSLFIPFLGYSLPLDFLVVAPVLGFLGYCLWKKKAWISRPIALCCCLLLLLYAVLPQTVKGGFWVDSRMPAMLGFVLFAGFLPRGFSARQQAMVASLFAVLFVTKVGFITQVWHSAQRDVRSVREVISHVDPASMVLVADVPRVDNPAWFDAMPRSRNISLLNPTYWHLAAFVTLDRRAFWPTVFAIDAQQPIRVLDPYRANMGSGAVPPNYEFLAARNLPADEMRLFPFIANWSNRFDYLLVLNAEGARDLNQFLPDKLELVDRRGLAALFRIKRSRSDLRASIR
jgi:hypothetical protein